MAVAYVNSGSGVTVFAISTAYSLGNRIVPSRSDTGPNHQLAKRFVWECTTAGTSAATNPVWSASITQDVTTVTSGTAVFTARKPGFSSGTTANWSFATIYMDYPWGASGLNATRDICYVASTHSESVGTTYGASPGNAYTANTQILSVDASATPPTTLLAGATVTISSVVACTFGAAGCYTYGVTYLLYPGQNGTQYPVLDGTHENCSVQLLATGSNPQVSFGIFKNCTIKTGPGGGNRIGTGVIIGGSFLAAASTPSGIFSGGVIAEDCDFSALPSNFNFTSTTNPTGSYRNCKLPAGWTGALNSSGAGTGNDIVMSAVDGAGTNYVYRRQVYAGITYSETGVFLVGGATDGYTNLSYRVVTNANARFTSYSCPTPEIVVWNDIVGSSITATVELLHDGVTSLTNAECWVELSYYSESGSPLGTLISSAAVVLATPSNLSSSTATWVTPGIATPNTQKISLSFTPQLRGFINARVYLARPSKTIYVDPKLTIT